MRDSVTLLGMTTTPRWAWYLMQICAGDLLYLSAMAFSCAMPGERREEGGGKTGEGTSATRHLGLVPWKAKKPSFVG